MERVPGLAVIGVGAIAAWIISAATPPVLGAAIPAVVIGWLIGAQGLPTMVRPGIKDGTARLLLAGVILLGFTIDLGALRGGTAPLLAASTIVVAIAVAWLTGRLLGIRGPLALLIGIGTAICGVAAMVAARPAANATDDDLVSATVLITVLGSAGMVVLPLMALAQGVDAWAAGQWMGASLHAVPQAIGAGLAAGGLAGADSAALVKLTRVALLPVAVIALGAMSGHKGRAFLPKEVIGFVAALALGNLIQWPGAVIDMAADVARWLFIGGLVGMGCQTSIQGIRDAGWRTWAVATVSFMAVVVAALAVLHL